METQYQRLAREISEAARELREAEANRTHKMAIRNAKIAEALQAGMSERLIARLAGLDSRSPISRIRHSMMGGSP